MIERVIIEIHDETTPQHLRQALPSHIELERKSKKQWLATVHDAKDAEEEITNLLNDAGIESYVYIPDSETLTQTHIWWRPARGRDRHLPEKCLAWQVQVAFHDPKKSKLSGQVMPARWRCYVWGRGGPRAGNTIFEGLARTSEKEAIDDAKAFCQTYEPPLTDAEKAVRARQDAADSWAEAFTAATRGKPLTGKKDKALGVIALDQSIRHYLTEHDPMALRQVQQALNGKDYTEYLKR